MLVSLALFLSAASQGDLISAPPEIRKPPGARCLCPDPAPSPDLILNALVVDAELSLSEDGQSTNPVQATIVEITRGDAQNTSGRRRIHHDTRETECGVSFDYGKTYVIPVRRVADGRLETDQCLMEWRREDRRPDGDVGEPRAPG